MLARVLDLAEWFAEHLAEATHKEVQS